VLEDLGEDHHVHLGVIERHGFTGEVADPVIDPVGAAAFRQEPRPVDGEHVHGLDAVPVSESQRRGADVENGGALHGLHDLEATPDHGKVLPSRFDVVVKVFLLQFAIELQALAVGSFGDSSQDLDDGFLESWIAASGVTKGAQL
jgi:hypothetical protein